MSGAAEAQAVRILRRAVSARYPDWETSRADARSALCLAAGVPPEFIDSLGYDRSDQAYRSVRASWIRHIAQCGVSGYVRREVAAVIAGWAGHRPDLAGGDDWLADGIAAHLAGDAGCGTRDRSCDLHPAPEPPDTGTDWVKGQHVRAGDDLWSMGRPHRVTRIIRYTHPVVTRGEEWRIAKSDGPGGHRWGMTLAFDHGWAASYQITRRPGGPYVNAVPEDDWLSPFYGKGAELHAEFAAAGSPGSWPGWLRERGAPPPVYGPAGEDDP